METTCVCLLLLLSVAAAVTAPPSEAQKRPSLSGYTCNATASLYPCQSYALYRAGPDDADLVSVGDLFGVSRLSIARANNLSSTAAIRPGDPLLVPLPCSCAAATNLSYAPVAYQIAAGDTFYLVSTYKFANLTTYSAVEAVNPSLVPTLLRVGAIVTFPIYCRCTSAGALVTYVLRPSDTFADLASRFGTDVPSLVTLNGREAGLAPFSVILIPVAQILPPQLNANGAAGAPPLPSPSPVIPYLPPRPARRWGIIGLSISLVLMILVSISLLAVLIYVCLSTTAGDGDAAMTKKKKKKGVAVAKLPSDAYLVADITEWLDKYRVFEAEELREATGGFGLSRLIEGSVYVGVIHGEKLAVKIMKWDASHELKILQKVNHTNLVKLEGFCIEPEAEGGRCYLVYEYVENGSLHRLLRDADGRRRLDWGVRLRIALDVANGLQYIHEHTWPRVVHKDVKSANVLLDAALRAKIANFGLAKTGTNAVTTHIVGTHGYIAPEYLADGVVTTKLDVFAYGVVLLELVSGREAVAGCGGGEVLWVDAEKARVKGGGGASWLEEWMDPAIVDRSPVVMESVASVVGVARACLQRDPVKRPTMVEVAYALSKAEDMFSDFSGDGLNMDVSTNSEVAAR